MQGDIDAALPRGGTRLSNVADFYSLWSAICEAIAPAASTLSTRPEGCQFEQEVALRRRIAPRISPGGTPRLEQRSNREAGADILRAVIASET